jgi:hypothetical protein
VPPISIGGYPSMRGNQHHVCRRPHDDQLFLAREEVIDSLLGHFGLARHVGHRNLFVSPLGKESGGSVRDEPPGTGLLEFTQSRVSHDSSIYGLL